MSTFLQIYEDLMTRRHTLPLIPRRWFSDVISYNILQLHLNGEDEKVVSPEKIILLYILNDDLAAARDLVISHFLAKNIQQSEERRARFYYLEYVLQRRLNQTFDLKSIVDNIPAFDPILEAIFDGSPLNARRFAEKVEKPGGPVQRNLMETIQMREMRMLKDVICSI